MILTVSLFLFFEKLHVLDKNVFLIHLFILSLKKKYIYFYKKIRKIFLSKSFQKLIDGQI